MLPLACLTCYAPISMLMVGPKYTFDQKFDPAIELFLCALNTHFYNTVANMGGGIGGD